MNLTGSALRKILQRAASFDFVDCPDALMFTPAGRIGGHGSPLSISAWTDYLASIAMSRIDFTKLDLEKPTNAVASIVAKLVAEEPKEAERRAHERHPLMMAIAAVAVDDDVKPISEPVTMITRDISSHGIGLIHTDPLDAKWIVIELPLQTGTEQFVVEVVRCQPVSRFYDIGGRFVRRLK